MAATNIITPGTRFNRLVFLRDAGKSNEGKRTGLFACDCGAEKVIRVYPVLKGMTKSCGCHQKERASESNITHGDTVGRKISRAYHTWASMKARCFNPARKDYQNYGGRGITVCKRWLEFENFLADMGEPPDGTSIDTQTPTGIMNRVIADGRLANSKMRTGVHVYSSSIWGSVRQSANGREN